MPIEDRFDVEFVARQAMREKQIQQNYRPVIAVHKWFARRPGSLFRGLVLAEFGDVPVREAFFRSNDFRGRVVADPFMGGGTPLLEANRVGCDVVGADINPMAYWVVRQELASIDLAAYRAAAEGVVATLRREIGASYETRCTTCGTKDADAKSFLWVKVVACPSCRADVALFPGFLVAEDARHPLNVFVCPACGELTEAQDRENPGACAHCGEALGVPPPARRGTCCCRSCGATATYPTPDAGPPRHRLFAIEYHCAACKPDHRGRFFKKPDKADLRRYADAEKRLRGMRLKYVPADAIPAGDETNRLHRWGYATYREMFNARQLLGLELSARAIARVQDVSIREALATNLSDLLRYQNMLCRYDTMALKALDVFSVHGFPVGLVQCESNLLGIVNGGGTNVGSGGWRNIVEKYARAKAYCVAPFEIAHDGGRKRVVPTPGEWIGAVRAGGRRRAVTIRCASSTDLDLAPGSIDAVLTDPPYFGNVQYAELMDFCYVWLRALVGRDHPAFAQRSTRNRDELTGNDTMARDLGHFTDGLSAVFRRMAVALKPGGPLAFTYHHNKLDAYAPVAVAILDAGLACTASIPCPAEMGASIHISGTGSSVVDTVFVCRATGSVKRRWLDASVSALADVIGDDLDDLTAAGLRVTVGDQRCITFGHLVRLAIWALRPSWDATAPAAARLDAVRRALASLPDVDAVGAALEGRETNDHGPLFRRPKQEDRRAVSF